MNLKEDIHKFVQQHDSLERTFFAAPLQQTEAVSWVILMDQVSEFHERTNNCDFNGEIDHHTDRTKSDPSILDSTGQFQFIYGLFQVLKSTLVVHNDRQCTMYKRTQSLINFIMVAW